MTLNIALNSKCAPTRFEVELGGSVDLPGGGSDGLEVKIAGRLAFSHDLEVDPVGFFVFAAGLRRQGSKGKGKGKGVGNNGRKAMGGIGCSHVVTHLFYVRALCNTTQAQIANSTNRT